MKKTTKIGLGQVGKHSPLWLKKLCNIWTFLTAGVTAFMMSYGFSDLITARTTACMVFGGVLLVALKYITGEEETFNPDKP